MKNVLKSPWFWGGAGLVVFARAAGNGAGQETGVGVENALTIIGIGVAAAAVIYALRHTAA